MKIIIISFVLVVVITLIILESVRRGILETKYSIIWLIACISMGILSSNQLLINWLAKLLNVYYAPSVIFLFGFLFSFIMIFDLTRRISKLNDQVVTLTQELAIHKQNEDMKRTQ